MHQESHREMLPLLYRYPDNLDLLQLKWRFAVETLAWDVALEAATSLQKLLPDDAHWWLNRAYALRRADGGGLQAAYDFLLPAKGLFAENYVIPYNLACYACQMKMLPLARTHLAAARLMAGEKAIQSMALQDEDLQALWPEIAIP